MGMLFIDRDGLEPLYVAWLVCSVVNTDLNCSFLDICLAYRSLHMSPSVFADVQHQRRFAFCFS